ncbi:MAG: group III truncated hemoglobin [Verrucomicrobiae bacterium]|nr:group III truncated hemoglobin [Verrucomicrobiae bacterium]
MPAVSYPPLPDIRDREDLRLLVDSFYEKVRDDDLLGFIFNDVASIDWDEHLPKMVDFWETIIFGSGAYRGNPLRPHLEVSARTPIGSVQFERWQTLFFATVDSLFVGERAEHIKNAAADMARVMLSRITGEPSGFVFAPDSPRPDT